MQLTLIASLVSALFAGAVGYGTAAHFSRVKITEMELAHANERISIQRRARATFERYSSAVSAAQSDAAARNVGLRSDAAAASNAAGGLRNTSAATVRTAAADTATCSRIVATYDQLLTDGSRLLQEIARDADQCVSERQTLVAAWPK